MLCGWLAGNVDMRLIEQQYQRLPASCKQHSPASILGPCSSTKHTGLTHHTELRCLAERAIRLKSFDYRVLNLLLYSMRHTEVDRGAMRFLSSSELLIEIGDDLFDYEADVERNSFNIFRVFVALYGAAAEMQLITWISELEAQYDQLLLTLPTALQEGYTARCREAMDHPLCGNWILPRPIVDEKAWRQEMLQFEDQPSLNP